MFVAPHELMRLILAAIATLAACDLPSAPQLAEPFDPPTHFARWWDEMQACSTQEADWRRVRWFRVPADSVGGFAWDGEQVTGVWYSNHVIYLSARVLEPNPSLEGDTTWARTRIQHEMLHDLRGQAGHPAVFDRCGVR